MLVLWMFLTLLLVGSNLLEPHPLPSTLTLMGITLIIPCSPSPHSIPFPKIIPSTSRSSRTKFQASKPHFPHVVSSFKNSKKYDPKKVSSSFSIVIASIPTTTADLLATPAPIQPYSLNFENEYTEAKKLLVSSSFQSGTLSRFQSKDCFDFTCFGILVVESVLESLHREWFSKAERDIALKKKKDVDVLRAKEDIEAALA